MNIYTTPIVVVNGLRNKIMKKELIVKVAERHQEWNYEGFKYDDVAEIVLTYSEGWKYEGEEMIELIGKIINKYLNK